MTEIFNGDTGEICIFIRKIPTGIAGKVDIEYQPPTRNFISTLWSMLHRPTEVWKNVPEDAMTEPIIVGPPDEQRHMIFMLQGENGNSRLLEQVGIFRDKTISKLRQQLMDEIVANKASQEEKQQMMRGAKSTSKMISDIRGAEKKRPFHFGRPPGASQEDDDSEGF